jgi:Xaa-Pro dipeptidase
MEKLITDIDYKTIELNALPQAFFKEIRQNYLDRLNAMLIGLKQNSIIVLQGGDELPRFDTDIIGYYFQQEANFYYLTGVKEPSCYAIYDITTNYITIYIKLSTSTHDRIYFKIPTLDELMNKYGVQFKRFEEMYPDIRERNPDKIYVLNGINSDSKLNVCTAKLDFPDEMKELEKRVDYNSYIYEILADCRTRKTQNEIALMAFINKATIEGHLAVHKNIKPGMYERDAENLFFNHMRQNYYTRIWAYPCICGAGQDAGTLHYDKNTKVLGDTDLIVLDMGIRIGGYCSDITSTIPVGGKFTEKQKSIYDLVLSANRTVMAQLKPGVSWPDMQLLAEKVIIDGLKTLGILNKQFDTIEMRDKRVGYYFMPCGVGHFLGLECHDAGGYLSFTPKRSDQLGLKSLRTARTLSEGNIITVEPGIYFIEYLIGLASKDKELSKYFNFDTIKTYMDIGGVRIEDDVLITYQGCINLTGSLPRTTEEIEALMQ